MLLTDPRERAARAIVRRLLDDESLETENPQGTEEDLKAVLAEYELRLEDVVEAARAATDRVAGRLGAFEQEARKRKIAWGDAAVGELRGKIVEALESSSNVAEIFADDETLGRVVTAALLDYMAVIEPRRLTSLREGSLASHASAKREAAPSSAVDARPTFADAGCPFPLFEAPRDDASIDDAGPCRFCRAAVALRFEGACYACFREGKAATSRDTELGAIDAESATTGLTNGVPHQEDFDPHGTEIVLPVAPSEEPWIHFRVEPSKLVELLRTPNYATWQGESWLFCCGAPMTYVGSVGRDHLEAWSLPANGSAEAVLTALLAPERVDAARFLADVDKGGRSLYAFRCVSCKKRRAHWDRD